MYKNQQKWLQIALMGIDGCISIVAIILAGIIRYESFGVFYHTINFAEIIVIASISSFVAFSISDMYRDIFRRGYLRELQQVTIYAFLILLFLSLYSFSTKNNFALSRLTLLYFFIVDILLVYSFQLLLKLLGKRHAKGQQGWKLLIIADHAHAAAACRNVQKSDWKDRVAGLIILDGKNVDPDQLSGIPLLQHQTTIMEYIIKNTVDEVLFSISEQRYRTNEISTLMSQIMETGAILSMNLRVPTYDSPHVSKLSNFGNSYVISFANREYDYLKIILKRVMDILGGLIGSLLALAAMVLLAPAILIESRGPLFFRQKRVGRNGRVFTMLKFRSMYVDAEDKKRELLQKNEMKGPLFKIKDDPRITRVGRFIRKTSLDEFPQFFNILAGDMSLVGTRPPTLDEYEKYTGAQKKRLSFRPGLTGIWQVSGRNRVVDFEDVIKMDLQYIQQWSLYLDIKLLLKTILVVLGGKGAQ